MVDLENKKDVQREQWLERKVGRIGSSDARAIFGYGYEGESKRTVWERLAFGTRKKFDFSKIELMREGQVMEPAIIEMFAVKNPEWEVRKNEVFELIIPEGNNDLCATLDAWAIHKETGEKIVIEAKNEQFGRFEDYDNDQVPKKHFFQVTHQLICTGYSQGVLVSLVRGRYTQRWIRRDEPVIDAMLQIYTELMEDARKGEFSGEDEGDSRSESVQAYEFMYTARYVGGKVSALAREAIKLQEEIAKATKRLDANRKEIRGGAKGCQYLLLDDQTVVQLTKGGMRRCVKLPANVRIEK